MTPVITFKRIRPWAITPERLRVNRSAAQEKREIHENNFRYVRSARVPELCRPWVMGQEAGWRVLSPIDVTLSPLEQSEVLTDRNEAKSAVAAANKSEIWTRNDSSLAVHKTNWLHLYQHQTESGWENMFLPNGVGTVEWKLGWAAEIPKGYFLMVMPEPESPPEIEVPIGILSSTVVSRLKTGLSLAIRPMKQVHVTRGQPIARLMLLHSESLQARSVIDENREAP